MQAIVLIATALLVLATCACAQSYNYTRSALRANEAPNPQAMANQFHSGQSRSLDDDAEPGAL